MNVWDFSGGGFIRAGETWPDHQSVESVVTGLGYVPSLTLGGRFSVRVFSKPACAPGDYEFVAAVRLGDLEYPVRVLSFPRLVDLLNTLAPIIRLESEPFPLPYAAGHGNGASSAEGNGSTTASPDSAREAGPDALPERPRPREPETLPACWGG